MNNRSRPGLLLAALTLTWAVAGACSDDPAGPGADAGLPDRSLEGGAREAAAGEAGAGDGGGVSALTFPPPTKWATPIQDYIKAGEAKFGAGVIYRHIWDLEVHRGRLYFGYGDATNNMGRVVAIQMRYFASPDRTDVVREYDTAEESVNTFRLLGGDLVVPGVDATEDAWLGNVYSRSGDGKWLKSRTLEGGVHVHDVALFKGKIYAVGSGSKKEEWGTSIFSYLWESSDQGKTFKVTDRKQNPGTGDIRYVSLLPLEDRMYVLGYRGSSSALYTNNATFDGSTRADLPLSHPLHYVWAHGATAVGPDLGMINGLKIQVVSKLEYAAWRVSGAKIERISALAGQRVVDVYRLPGQQAALVMTHDGAEYGKTLTSWKIHIYYTTDLVSFKELLSFATFSAPQSLAYWNQGIYLGTTGGEVWRSVGQ